MSETDKQIADLEHRIKKLTREIAELEQEMIKWRGMTRVLGFAMSHSYSGPAALEREEGDRYRRAVWALASWIYGTTADRTDDAITPDLWVRWALEQEQDPKPPPVAGALGSKDP